MQLTFETLDFSNLNTITALFLEKYKDSSTIASAFNAFSGAI